MCLLGSGGGNVTPLLLQTVVPSVVIVSVPAVLLGGLATGAAVGGVVLGIGAYGTGSELLGPLAAAMFLFPVAALFSLVGAVVGHHHAGAWCRGSWRDSGRTRPACPVG